ncbi:MAG: amidohydrolase [Gammaproteobacteria bacterium]|uniref:M20 aminoacylase family protein n=1 Tax=Methylotuvimicrobium sp. TaxID=2822413 RepID=UPI001D8702BE|nr:amidohydrolase [Gammaproteobacteria bacterium]
MTTVKKLSEWHASMRQWRRHLHQFPETAFEENETARFIAARLREFGLDVHQGLGKTGIVASLTAGTSSRKIALRADMDALFIQEQNKVAHRSKHDGKMHACGHDGHSAMLLGAAGYLSRCPQFDGTVYFIFQPAEEGRAGAKRMIDDGLFKLFPVDFVFGMHNYHDIPEGYFAVKSGPMMASFDCFEIVVTGHAAHAAMPHLGNDAIVAAAQVISALQSIVSRTVDPLDSAVVSITQIHGGDTWNALPESVVLRGTFRCFKPAVQELIADKIRKTVEGICAGLGVSGSVVFNPENPGYPVLVNEPNATELALLAATKVAGSEGVDLCPVPSMGSEDFAFMLQQVPGCYVWIGNGPSEGGCLLHNPHYDFNDAILPMGAAYWVGLVETVLPAEV